MIAPRMPPTRWPPRTHVPSEGCCSGMSLVSTGDVPDAARRCSSVITFSERRFRPDAARRIVRRPDLFCDVSLIPLSFCASCHSRADDSSGRPAPTCSFCPRYAVNNKPILRVGCKRDVSIFVAGVCFVIPLEVACVGVFIGKCCRGVFERDAVLCRIAT